MLLYLFLMDFSTGSILWNIMFSIIIIFNDLFIFFYHLQSLMEIVILLFLMCLYLYFFVKLFVLVSILFLLNCLMEWDFFFINFWKAFSLILLLQIISILVHIFILFLNRNLLIINLISLETLRVFIE